MNFLELQNKVIEKLKERSTPKYWPLSEIKDNINRGCRRFIADTKCRTSSLPVRVADALAGTFFHPSKVIELLDLRWNGTKLHRVTAEFMDANTGQNASAELVRGEDYSTTGNWQTATGTPAQWLIEDGMIRLYPIPSDFAALAAVRTKQEATLSAGSSVITFAGPLPTSQSIVDLYINGVWQNSSEWSVTAATQITVTGTIPIDVTCEVVFFPTAAASAATKQFKYLLAGALGQTSFLVPRPYTMGASALSVKVNGVSQAPSAVTETSTTSFALSALPVASEIEVTILEGRTAFDLVARCVTMPTDMTADTQEPDMPSGLEYYHDALWNYALYECYSREGQEKRMDLAEFYGQKYGGVVEEYRRKLGSAPVLMQPRDAWRI